MQSSLVVLFANAVTYSVLTELDTPTGGPMLRGHREGHSEPQP